MEFKNLRIKKNNTKMKVTDKEQSNNESKDFPLLKVIVFSIYGLLIYCIYYLIRFGI